MIQILEPVVWLTPYPAGISAKETLGARASVHLAEDRPIIADKGRGFFGMRCTTSLKRAYSGRLIVMRRRAS